MLPLLYPTARQHFFINRAAPRRRAGFPEPLASPFPGGRLGQYHSWDEQAHPCFRRCQPEALSMDHPDRLSALKRVPLLAGLPGASLERVARDCKWQQFEAGEQVVDYQEASTEVFFLTEG